MHADQTPPLPAVKQQQATDVGTHAGGYNEDALTQGAWGASAYAFAFWQCIDAFIYFSHHLVSPPPPGWTDAAHSNGVPILGTFIAEWEAGSKVCQEVFRSRAAAAAAAAQLAAIAAWHSFDGWLVRARVVSLILCSVHVLHDSFPLLRQQPTW